MAVENVLTKMRKYYACMKDESDLLYNIAIIFDFTQKFSLYKICFLLIFYLVFLMNFTNYYD